MLDLRGREIRVGLTKNDEPLEFEVGDQVRIRTDDISLRSNKTVMQLDCPELPKVMRTNDILYFSDGAIMALVINVEADEITIEFKEKGQIRSHMAVKLTGSKYSMIPLMRKDDIEEVKLFSENHKFDFICLPGVQTGNDIVQARLALG